MSASKQKKIRKQQRDEGTDKRTTARLEEERKAKRSKIITAVITTIVVVLAAAVILINSNLFYKNFSAVTVGDESYTAAELSYFYNTAYYSYTSQYGQMLTYMGLDTSRPLDSQQYGEDQTWADFFKDIAIDNMQSVTMLWKEAQKEGFTLTGEQREELESQLSELDTVHQTAGFPSANKYLAAVYGKGVTKALVAELTERSYIAEMYSQYKNDSFTYTDAELESKYEENKDNYDTYSFMSVFVSGAADEDAGIDAETAMAEAKDKLDELVESDIENEEDFSANAEEIAGVAATPQNISGSTVLADYAEWMKDKSREEGDMTVVETSNGYTAVYFISRSDNDYNTKNVRHILVKAVADENGEYTAEAKKAAREKAEELLALWKEGDATEDTFAEMAGINSEDTGSTSNGGLYENVSRGRMVEEFNDWIFDEARKPGDTGIVFNEDSSYCGYHVMYFVGDGGNYRQLQAESTLRSDDYDAWNTETLEKYPVSRGFTAGFVGR